ncbi:MAG: OmpA family protein, partial [Hyphococcus sp.]
RVLEERPLETGKIALVRADALAEKIGVDGRIALYGIEFDVDSDVVRASSAPQIAEVASFLKGNPQANVLVVGHTDTTGAFDYNRDLSERRAAAVVAKLTGEHAISADRLFAVGVGPASPIATNRTEEGRARNRRVEIVDLPQAE